MYVTRKEVSISTYKYKRHLRLTGVDPNPFLLNSQLRSHSFELKYPIRGHIQKGLGSNQDSVDHVDSSDGNKQK